MRCSEPGHRVLVAIDAFRRLGCRAWSLDAIAMKSKLLPVGGFSVILVCLHFYLTTSNAKPFRYSVSGIAGMTGWSGDWL